MKALNRAGKRHSGRTSKGNRYVRRVPLGGGSHQPETDVLHNAVLSDQQPGRKEESGRAVAHRLLCLIYSLILTGSSYREQGVDYFDRLHPEPTRNRLTAGLERLGFLVTLAPKPFTESS